MHRSCSDAALRSAPVVPAALLTSWTPQAAWPMTATFRAYWTLCGVPWVQRCSRRCLRLRASWPRCSPPKPMQVSTCQGVDAACLSCCSCALSGCVSFLLFADAEATASAQLNCVHLVHTMAKLLPGWLPQPLFNVALQRWRSADFKARWACLPARLHINSCPAAGAQGPVCALAACVHLLFLCVQAGVSLLPAAATAAGEQVAG